MSANSLEVWRRARAQLTRAEYQELYPFPFLISDQEPAGSSGLYATAQLFAFHTQVHPLDARAPRTRSTQPPEELLVLPLRKADKNPFPDCISVGRAPNCDVVIRAPSVSKLHGHFREVRADAALFTDAKSANGTRVDDVTISPGEAVPLKEFCHVSFGRVRLQLLSAASLYDWLEELF